MDETQIAQAIAVGELTSPQEFANSWYFALRISGTGTAYRRALDEYVYRRPDNYLSPEFLARCNGLPVVILHPAKAMLDSKEFASRVIGAIVLPFVGREGVIDQDGNEVWGIARVLDQDAARFMREHQLSTSPAVVFALGANTTIDLSDGKHLLIEGKPALLDHLAICEHGVWDKSGPPSGVEAGLTEIDVKGGEAAATGEKAMADEAVKVDPSDPAKEFVEKVVERGEDEARSNEKLDKMLAKLDAIDTRMDAIEDRHREDAARADSARKDTEDAEEEERQAQELEKLAEEEHEEASEAEARGDAAPACWLARHDGESVTEHSNRVHAFAARHDAAGWCRKDGEAAAEHSARCDSMAKKYLGRKDAEGKPIEPERSDETEAEKKAKEDKERMDATARKDAEIAQIRADAEKDRRKLADLERKVEDRSDDEEVAFADAQARADDVYAALGERAPRPLTGERLMNYRLRLAKALQPHSEVWKDTDLPAIARADAKSAFPNAERLIYADAMEAARRPSAVPGGTLRQVTRTDRTTGRVMHEFVGEPLVWMSQFMPPAAGVTRLGKPKE